MPLGRQSWEGLSERRSRARRTACLTITVIPTRDGEGILTQLLRLTSSRHFLPGFVFKNSSSLYATKKLPTIREAFFAVLRRSTAGYSRCGIDFVKGVHYDDFGEMHRRMPLKRQG